MAKGNFLFNYSYLKKQFEISLSHGYEIVTCEYFAKNPRFSGCKILINRIDVDFSIKKCLPLCNIFNELNIKGTFFIRLHAPEYNPFSFENYRIIRFLVSSGHEIGYHSEVIDESVIWNEEACECLKRDLCIFNIMFKTNISGVASHGGMTGLNNLNFWKSRKPADFDLLYEAYDWFDKIFYVSDSEWTKWKCYNKGILIKDYSRSLGDHILDQYEVIYSLIHSYTFFSNHFYE